MFTVCNDNDRRLYPRNAYSLLRLDCVEMLCFFIFLVRSYGTIPMRGNECWLGTTNERLVCGILSDTECVFALFPNIRRIFVVIETIAISL